MEERIINLENTVAFQEHSLAELSDFVREQQMQLQALEKEVRRLTDKLNAPKEPELPPVGEEPPPPHY